MSTQPEAIHENGVFRPLQPVSLPERWEAFCNALDAPPRDIPALRKLLTEASLFDANGNAAP